MPFAHKVIRYTAFGTCFGADEEWSTGFYIGAEATDAVNPTQLTANAFLTAWETFFKSSNANIANSYKTVGVRVALMNEDGKMDPAHNFYAYPTVPFSGFNPASPMPAQISLVASLQARPDRGLASKGRMFLPGVNASCDTSGRISGTTTTNIATQLDTMFTALNAGFDTGGYLINASKGGTGVNGPAPVNRRVEDILVGNVYDTQRRRRNQLTETYSTRQIEF